MEEHLEGAPVRAKLLKGQATPRVGQPPPGSSQALSMGITSYDRVLRDPLGFGAEISLHHTVVEPI
jgi:hypothetical protein